MYRMLGREALSRHISSCFYNRSGENAFQDTVRAKHTSQGQESEEV